MITESELNEKNEMPELKTASGAFLVGLALDGQARTEVRENLDELKELVSTLGMAASGELVAQLRDPQPKYFVGSGKAQEIADAAKKVNSKVIVFDAELGPSQQRNMEKLCGMKVLDRQEIILDIFAGRARTKEAVLQVELARYKYYLPRLTRAWSHLSRQHGGAMGTRGEGEKQIENDRREVKAHIRDLEKDLKLVQCQRGEQRKERLRRRVPHAVIVGYTNAGKSSLLNRLTGADAYVEDKLFATLDPTTRRFQLPDKTELLLTDTVGFVRKLPHALIEAFKSTLEETVLADFLVLVLDVSSPSVEAHRETTLRVLSELGAGGKPVLTVFNKCDRPYDALAMNRLKAAARGGVCISCATGSGLDDLVDALRLYAGRSSSIRELEIPPSRPDIAAMVHARCTLIEGKYLDDGTYLCTARIPDSVLSAAEPFFKKNKSSKLEVEK